MYMSTEINTAGPLKDITIVIIIPSSHVFLKFRKLEKCLAVNKKQKDSVDHSSKTLVISNVKCYVNVMFPEKLMLTLKLT